MEISLVEQHAKSSVVILESELPEDDSGPFRFFISDNAANHDAQVDFDCNDDGNETMPFFYRDLFTGESIELSLAEFAGRVHLTLLPLSSIPTDSVSGHANVTLLLTPKSGCHCIVSRDGFDQAEHVLPDDNAIAVPGLLVNYQGAVETYIDRSAIDTLLATKGA